MISRRILVKSLSFLSGAAILTGLPANKAAAQPTLSSLRGFGSKKVRIVLVGDAKWCEPFIEYALLNPEKMEIVAIAGTQSKNNDNASRQLGISHNACFSDFKQLLESGISADIALIAGQKDVQATAFRAVKAGYHVWSDRPIALTPSECKKVNGVAAGYFCKVHLAFVINDEICLMENKIYNARV